MNITKSRMAAVAAGAAVLVTLAGVGGATAGALITSADIKDGTIAKVDLHGSAVTSGKIKDGAVKSADIADGTITAGDIASGVIPTAAPAAAVAWVSATKSVTIASGTGSATVTSDLLCATGKVVVSLSEDADIVVSSTEGTADVNTAAWIYDQDDNGDNPVGLDSITLDVSGAGSATSAVVSYKFLCA